MRRFRGALISAVRAEAEVAFMARVLFTKSGPDQGGSFEYHWTGDYLEAHFLSDVGKKREHNEDSCLMSHPEDADAARTYGALFAVADGMGGASAGEYASRMTLQRFSQEFFNGPTDSIPEKLYAAVKEANREVFEAAENNPEYHGMGTTLSAVLIVGNCAYVAQVGDSRVYVSRNGGPIVQVTQDHSVVAEQVRNGFIDEEDARNHSMKNLITRAIGIKEDVKVDLFGFYIMQGDNILVCSDGLNNMVTDKDITGTIRIDSLQGAARVLVGRALEGGGADNITVSLIRVTGVPPKFRLDPDVDETVIPKAGFFGRLKRMISA